VAEVPDAAMPICYQPRTLPRDARFAGFSAGQIMTSGQLEA